MVNVLGTSYHFPNGYNSSFGVERFKPTEALFNATNVNLKARKTRLEDRENALMLISRVSMALGSLEFPK